MVADSWEYDVPRNILPGNIGVASVDRLGMMEQNNIMLHSGEDVVGGIEVGYIAGHHDKSVELRRYLEWVEPG